MAWNTFLTIIAQILIGVVVGFVVSAAVTVVFKEIMK